jgi:anti-sigma factor RsiW
MKMDHNCCDPAVLSRFLDKELGPDEHCRIDKHLKYCPACQKVLRANQSISTFLRAVLEEELSHADVEDFEEGVLDRIQRKGVPWWMKLRSLFLSKKFYVPAAAMATVLILLFSVVRRPAPEPGPSAIINSFKGDVASVMILETRKSHQTILWFNENLMSGDDNGET